MKRSIFYLPGRGGELFTGLGAALIERRCTITGIEIRGDFQRLRFSEQVDIVAGALMDLPKDKQTQVIANSFGAYLFLHAQSLLDPIPSKVLLLSPIVGGVARPGSGMGMSPPQADRLFALGDIGKLSAPQICEIHVGAEDWQCPVDSVKRMGALIGAHVHVVPRAGHMLPKNYVNSLLDRWLPE